jgi:hypothetical protein
MLVFNIYIFKFKEVPETVSQVNVQKGERNFPQKNAIVFETENSLTKISFVAATADAAWDETVLLPFVSLLCSKEVENASDAPLWGGVLCACTPLNRTATIRRKKMRGPATAAAPFLWVVRKLL